MEQATYQVLGVQKMSDLEVDFAGVVKRKQNPCIRVGTPDDKCNNRAT